MATTAKKRGVIQMEITHYKLDDGRFWDIQNAQFVTSTHEGAVICPCPDGQGNNSLEGLIGCLKFYHFPLGELANQASDYMFDILRTKRDKLLADTDYLVMPDYPIDSDKLISVRVYRQALRDLPAQEGAPWTESTIPWPKNPME